MGVMTCHRLDCDNIMCSVYIDENDIGYICHECMREFEDSNPSEMTESKLVKRLKKFMLTSKTDVVEKVSENLINVSIFFWKRNRHNDENY
ncbi:gp283 [Sphingomonas phage PAU]|uniref:gp283 n=1 Tax=Sphingomonas phage PAU TaxID=1150991 RepID=UPI000257349A|nr:gp283 [Sphingomonas phage PAU]AFF28281.1 gp283 [Sphingomonas phage PAU]